MIPSKMIAPNPDNEPHCETCGFIAGTGKGYGGKPCLSCRDYKLLKGKLRANEGPPPPAAENGYHKNRGAFRAITDMLFGSGAGGALADEAAKQPPIVADMRSWKAEAIAEIVLKSQCLQP